MDQENLCFRSYTCRLVRCRSNTLGNDNSVTGFTDHSDNLRAAAAPTAPGNNTAPVNNTTPTPTPRTCEQCFSSLNSTQLTLLLSTFSESSLATLCTTLGATPISETALQVILQVTLDFPQKQLRRL
jgi:hypothetical protein